MKKALLLLMLLPFYGLSQTLSGTYHVGAAQQAPFKKITTAVNALAANGISGPVTLILDDALYTNATGETFPISINPIPGSSTTKTVTIRPKTGVNVKIEASNATLSSGVPAVFKFNGAQNIVIDGASIAGATTKNLTIDNKDIISSVSRSVIWVASVGSTAAANITVKNTFLKHSFANGAGVFCAGVYSGANTTGSGNSIAVATSTANNSNLQVINNTFTNVKQGVYINAGSPVTTNVVVQQNNMGAQTNGEAVILPVYLKNVQTFSVAENIISNVYRNNSNSDLRTGGIVVEGNSTNGSIVKNMLSNITRTNQDAFHFAGILLNCSNSSTSIEVTNNFILNVTGPASGNAAFNGHGIALIAGKGYKLYNNTVKLEQNQTGGYTAALFIEDGVSNIDVRNNIFANLQTNTNTRRVAIMIRKSDNVTTNSMFSYLNFNDYISNDKIGYLGSNSDWSTNPEYRATLAQWKAATGKDVNSVSITPAFVSATDLHLAAGNTALDNLGTPIASVTSDIDGQLRNTTTPDMGADEFGAATVGSGVSNAGIYCSSSTTWNGTAWSNGVPTGEKDAVFTGNYTQNGGVLTACSMHVRGTAIVTFQNNSNAVVKHNVNVESTASLTFESSSNLIQLENTQNVGNVTIKRLGSKLKKLDYTFWSSPVTGTQKLQEFSPATLSNRFYTYNTSTNSYLSVTSPSTTTFTTARAYLIRMPNEITGEYATAYAAGGYRFRFEGVFKGVPNNGDVYIPLTYTSTTNSYNGVGNPYPSPISITDFIDANIDNIEGTIWIWRKTNNPNETSYCTITKLGFAGNNALGGGGAGGNDGNDVIADPFTIENEGVLNTGQGFIVKAKTNQNLVFRNNMRKATNFTNFFRAGETDEEEQATNEVVASRLWLNVTNAAADVYSQAMVGYTSQATTGYDNGLDGRAFVEGAAVIYSVADNEKLAIQGRPEFSTDDAVQLGFKTQAAGDFIIKLDHVNGLFSGDVNIYIKDNATGVIHDIRNSDYTFTSEAGTFENRFEIVYTNTALGVANPAVDAKEVVIYNQGQQVKVQSPEEISSVTIYDIQGKVLFQNDNVNASEFTSSQLTARQQVIIVNTVLANKQVVSKKIMMN